MDEKWPYIALFSELYKIIVKKVTFVGFRRGDRAPPWIPPWLCMHQGQPRRNFLSCECGVSRTMYPLWVSQGEHIFRRTVARKSSIGGLYVRAGRA